VYRSFSRTRSILYFGLIRGLVNRFFERMCIRSIYSGCMKKVRAARRKMRLLLIWPIKGGYSGPVRLCGLDFAISSPQERTQEVRNLLLGDLRADNQTCLSQYLRRSLRTLYRRVVLFPAITGVCT
jgi:hypothetical protein